MQHIQIQISKKLKIFSEFFTAFVKSPCKFQHFKKKKKKIEPHSLYISEIIDCKKPGFVND